MTADVRYDVQLRCDEPGCKAKYPERGDLTQHWEYVRKQAAKEGWSYSAMRGDFCPDHRRVQ